MRWCSNHLIRQSDNKQFPSWAVAYHPEKSGDTWAAARESFSAALPRAIPPVRFRISAVVASSYSGGYHIAQKRG